VGFEPQIRSIIQHIPKEKNVQTLLFSATWPKEIQVLAHEFLKSPIQINVGQVNALVANQDICQTIHVIREDDKMTKLIEILRDLIVEAATTNGGGSSSSSGNGTTTSNIQSKTQHAKVIVFVAKKINCHHLANQLWDDGFAVDSLHGDRPQWERTKVMGAFKSGELRMLIATDVAARGLDVKDVGVVINYDMPSGVSGVEDYVHRIGRTGRAGNKGIAHTFFTHGDKKCAAKLVEVLKAAKQEIPPELDAMVPRPRFSLGTSGGRGGRFGSRGGGYNGGRGGRGYMSSGRGYMNRGESGDRRSAGGRGFGRGSGRGFARGRGSY
jgi:ATP-dependent RNA helicase DDX5/DBP2